MAYAGENDSMKLLMKEAAIHIAVEDLIISGIINKLIDRGYDPGEARLAAWIIRAQQKGGE